MHELLHSVIPQLSVMHLELKLTLFHCVQKCISVHFFDEVNKPKELWRHHMSVSPPV